MDEWLIWTAAGTAVGVKSDKWVLWISRRRLLFCQPYHEAERLQEADRWFIVLWRTEDVAVGRVFRPELQRLSWPHLKLDLDLTSVRDVYLQRYSHIKSSQHFSYQLVRNWGLWHFLCGVWCTHPSSQKKRLISKSTFGTFRPNISGVWVQCPPPHPQELSPLGLDLVMTQMGFYDLQLQKKCQCLTPWH